MSKSMSASKYSKPYYSIEIEARNLGVQIRVNDIPVFEVDDSGFLNTEVPINAFIKSDKNAISIITYPAFDDEDEQDEEYTEGSLVNVDLYVREDSDSTEKRQKINSLSIRPSKAYSDGEFDSVAVIDKIVNATDVVNVERDTSTLNFPLYGVYKKQVMTTWRISDMETPFSQWQWEKGKQIVDTRDNYQSLLKAYDELHRAFSQKNLDAIKKISTNRSKEYAEAYYLGSIDAGFEFSALGDYLNHPTAQLYNQLYTEDTKLEILANEKLARIIDGAGNQPVVFVDDESGLIHAAQFLWYKNKHNEWVLIR